MEERGRIMDPKRAEEIRNSEDMVHVTYNGEPVYIEHVDKSAGYATVHPINDKHNKLSVALSELNES